MSPALLNSKKGRLMFGAAGAAFLVMALSIIFGGEDDAALAPVAAQASTAPADVGDVEVMHFWNAGSERAALDVVREAFVGNGGRWVDNTQPDNPTLRRSLIERISINTPPTAVLWQSSDELRDLAEVGVFGNLDDVAERQHWNDVLPIAVRQRVQVDGHYIMAPTNVHVNNWIYYNPHVLERLGLQPPKTWNEMIAAMQRARAAGVRPIALGSGDWEVQVMFSAILAGSLGREEYRRLIRDQDADVLMQPSGEEAFRVLGVIRDFAREQPRYASWDDASRAVASGHALFQFMGDWAKGELKRAGLTPGRDFGCMLAPGTENAVMLTVDGFAFPASTLPQHAAERDALASVMLDRDVQMRFAEAKGTLAARADAVPVNPDICEAKVIAELRDPAASLITPGAGLSSAVSGDMQLLISRYFANPHMSPAAARDSMAETFRTSPRAE